ncbi:MAG: ferredoxin [Pseudonocardiales bacterium]|jgi:ferredoxin|nr:ferredoxin [Pseudonocardiales bacterium]
MTAVGAAPRQLSVDWTRCDGHGLCAALLPAAVQLDDWGYPIIDQAAIAGASEPEVKRAISACPALALRMATR